MPDPTRARAYLARIKDQEKDVIAVPDGAGRALCVSSDKHWTLTREWDELHIIAPLVEAARWELAESERDFSGVDWKVMYAAMERERDDWRDKANSASEGMRKATARAEATERSRDAWKARADVAKRERDALREAAEARTAPTVTRDDIEKAIRGKVWAANRDPNKAGFHRVHIAWATDSVWSLVSGADPAVHVVRESDVAAVEVRRASDGWYADGAWLASADETAEWVRDRATEMVVCAARNEAVARMIEAEKLTGFGKHENTTALAVDDKDIEAVKVESVDDGKWWLADGALINTCESPNADEAREAAEEYLELAKGAEAVARAIEDRENSIMVRARELLNLAYPGEYAWTGAFETCRKIAEAEAKKVRDA